MWRSSQQGYRSAQRPGGHSQGFRFSREAAQDPADQPDDKQGDSDLAISKGRDVKEERICERYDLEDVSQNNTLCLLKNFKQIHTLVGRVVYLNSFWHKDAWFCTT